MYAMYCGKVHEFEKHFDDRIECLKNGVISHMEGEQLIHEILEIPDWINMHLSENEAGLRRLLEKIQPHVTTPDTA